MLSNEEIARQISELIYPEESSKARLEAFKKAGKHLLEAIGPGVSEYTTLGAAMREMQDLLDDQGPIGRAGSSADPPDRRSRD